mgnify:FL=1
MLKQYAYCPGNGARYHLAYSTNGRGSFIAWMKRGGSGGTCMQFGGGLHVTYLIEKMDIRMGDAVAILCFLKLMGDNVHVERPSSWKPATLDELTQYP